MPWVKVKGLAGRLYVPDKELGREKKHNCRDCDMCQWCSDTRCNECLKRKTCAKRAARLEKR